MSTPFLIASALLSATVMRALLVKARVLPPTCARCGRLLERRALDIALSAGLDEQAARAFKNLHSRYADHRRFAEAEPYFTDGVAYCD